MIAVLAPSKTMDFKEKCLLTGEEKKPFFPHETATLAETVRSMGLEEIMGLMKIKEPLARNTASWFAEFSCGRDRDRLKPAIHAFRGDAYKGLCAQDFSRDELLEADGRVRILSGLYGILTPLTLMEPYRLEMGLKLGSFGRLSLHWRDKVTETLNRELSGHSSKVLVNLASKEYFSAVDTKKISGSVLDVVFKERRNGVLKVVAVSAKKARGMMAAFMIRNRLENPGDLKSFTGGGFCFEQDLSREGLYCYVKE